MNGARARRKGKKMSPRVLARSVLALIAALAVAVLASGCGSGGAAAVLDPVAKAAETTSNTDGAKLEMHVRLDLGSLGGLISLDGHGQVNFKHREGQISMQFSGLPAAAASVLGEDATISELFTGDAVYVESPSLAGKLPNGARWIKIDVAAAARTLGLDPQSLSSGQANPAQFLDYLRSLGGTVREAGTDTVRGVQATRYTGTIDLHKVIDQLPSSDRGAAQAAIDKMISELGAGSIPVQVWVDAQQMVRKMEIAFPLTAGGQRLESSVTLEFFDFGPTPAVQAPAASETYEVSPGSLGSGA
jgi:hypothetical protein